MSVLIDYLFNYHLYIQLLPVLAGFFVWKRLEKHYKWFVVILLYSFLNEVFKLIYGTYVDYGSNRIFTNIYNTIYFGFLFWLFYQFFKSQFIKKMIISFAMLFIFGVFIDLFVLNLNYISQTYVFPFIFGGFGIIYCCFYYLLQMLNIETNFNVLKHMLFWIVITHFIYYLTFMLFKIAENYYAEIEGFHWVFNFKIPVTYFKCLFLSIGFIWTTRKNQ